MTLHAITRLQDQARYNVERYGLPGKFVEEVSRLRPARSVGAIGGVWLTTAALILTVRYLLPADFFWAAYVPVIFLIAGRQGAFLQLMHEAAHRLLHPSAKVNHALGRWLCAYPIGLSLEGYTRGHMLHHAHTNTSQDPPADTEKYRVTDVRRGGLYLLFLKDLLGLTALSIFFRYKKDADAAFDRQTVPFAAHVRNFAGLCAIQLFILAVFFQLNVLHYVLLWLVPAMGPHMFLMRIRGIAEHGLSRQAGVDVSRTDEGTFYTRSFLTPQNRYRFLPLVWLEKLLIGTLDVYYHHEHHLLLNVPFYNLKKVHARVAPEVRAVNPEIYSRGYFTAALRNILKSP